MFEQDIQQLQKYYDMAMEYMVAYSFQLLGAVIIFFAFLWLSNKLGKTLHRFLLSKQLDVTLSQFLGNFLRFVILAIGIVITLGKVGVSVTPFVAAIGAASLGVGLALQGMLSNYGAGFAIIMTRPFTVGNTITVQDITGVVKEVKLAATILVNGEGQDIVIPNKYLIGDILFNSYQHKLVENKVGINYDSDVEQAIAVIRQTLASFEWINQQKPVQVGIDEFGDSSIVIGMRFWVPTKEFYERKYSVNLAVFNALKTAGIKIPFPQREVRVLSD